MTKWIAAVVAVGALIFGGVSMTQAGEDAGLAIGKPAPGFELQDQNGKTVSLAEFKGKIVVVEWFNDECPFVVKFYKDGHMNQWAQKYAEKDVVWLAIDSSNFSTVAQNKEIAGKWNINRPLLDDHSGKVGKLYQSKNTPTMYIIDKEGNLAYWGAIDSIKSSDTADIAKADNYVAKALDEMLAGNPVSTTRTQPYGCSVKYAK